VLDHRGIIGEAARVRHSWYQLDGAARLSATLTMQVLDAPPLWLRAERIGELMALSIDGSNMSRTCRSAAGTMP